MAKIQRRPCVSQKDGASARRHSLIFPLEAEDRSVNGTVVPIPLIIGSTRTGRQTPKAARRLERELVAGGAAVEVIDLAELALPFLPERLKYLSSPPAAAVSFSRAIARCARYAVVSSEYNGGPSGVLKNAIDYLTDEYKGKLVGVVVVSSGPRGGQSCPLELSESFRRPGAAILQESFVFNIIAASIVDDGAAVDAQYSLKAASPARALRGA